jgi:beta-lactamase regulating signal transducer with metallopeptidase domain
MNSWLFSGIEGDLWTELGNGLVRASWQGGVAIGLAWLVVRWWRGLSPRIACWLWRLASVKVLVALVWAVPLAIPLLPAMDSSAAIQPTNGPRWEFTGKAEIQPQAAQAEKNGVDEPGPSTDVAAPMRWGLYLLGLWGFGAVVRLGIDLRQWWWIQRVRRQSQLVVSERLTALCQEQARRMGIWRRVQLGLSTEIESPLLTGITQPTILLPARVEAAFSESEIGWMLAHELAHQKRHDLAWNWLPTICGWLFWFHPLVWGLRVKWCEAQEAACDELVVQRQGGKRWDYGAVLVRLASDTSRPMATWAAAGVLGTYRDLERRILSLATVRPASRRRLVSAAFVMSLVALLGITPWQLVARAAVDAPQKDAPKEAEGTLQIEVEPVITGTLERAEPQAAVILSEAQKKVLARLKELGATPATSLAIGFQSGWKGTNEDLKLVNELHPKSLFLGLRYVAPAGIGDLKIDPPPESLVLEHISDEILASLNSLPAAKKLTILRQTLTPKGCRKLVELMPQLESIAFQGPYATDGETARLDDACVVELAQLKKLNSLMLLDANVGAAGLEALAKTGQLATLTLIKCEKVDAAALAKLASLESLRHLTIHSAPLDADGLRMVCDLKQLETLELQTKSLDAGAAKQLSRLSNLRRLTVVVENDIVSAPNGSFIIANGAHLDGKTLTFAGGLCISVLKATEEMANLEYLTLHGAPVPGVLLETWKNVPHLQSLILQVRELEDEHLKTLAGRTELVQLALEGKGTVGDAGLAHLRDLRALTLLAIPAEQATDDGLKSLAGLTALAHVTLNGSQITGRGLGALNPGLESLSLQKTPFNDEGAKELAKFSKLSTLDLSGSKITDGAMDWIAQLPRLRSLQLMDTAVTPEGLRKLAGLKRLQMITWDGEATPEQMEELRKVLPRTGIQREPNWTYFLADEEFEEEADGAVIFQEADEQEKPEEKPAAEEEEEKVEPEVQGSSLLRDIRRNSKPLLEALAEKHGYGLKEGEAVRRVPLPFAPLRMEYYRVGHPSQSELIPAGPSAMLFHWKQGQLINWGLTFGQNPEDGYSVQGILSELLNLKGPWIEGPAELLSSPAPGDWVVRVGAPQELIAAQFETILRKDLKIPARLSVREVHRPVIVATGDYRFTPLPGRAGQETLILTDETVTTDPIEIFASEIIPDSGSGGGTGSLDEMLQWVGAWIELPVVSEVQEQPSRQISWRLNGRTPFTEAMRAEDHDADKVLANVAKQTGLRFRRETRPVRVVVAEWDR